MITHQPHNSVGDRSYNTVTYKNIFYAPHFHRNFEIIYVMEGEVAAVIGGRKRTLGPGQFALCLSNEIHEYRSVGNSLCWIIVFSSDFVPDFERAVKGKTGEDCCFCPDPEIHRFVKKYLVLRTDKDPYRFSACLSLLCGEYLSHVRLTARDDRESSLINEVTDHISNNYREPLSLSSVAKALGYDYFYFSRLFKRTFGVCFSEYLNAYRFNIAAEALLTTKRSVTDIAFESGFQSIRTFNDVFRKKTGLSPSRYRSSIK